MGKDDFDFDDDDAVRQQKREGEEDMLQQYSLVLVVVVRRALLLRKSERKKAFDSLGMKSEEIFTRMHSCETTTTTNREQTQCPV